MQPVDFMNGCDSNAEAWVLHSCCYLAHLTSLSHLGKEKPEEANARLWRASASSGTAAPLGCVVLLFVCQHCAPLALFVALAGYVSFPATERKLQVIRLNKALVIVLLAPGTHSHFESGKFSQFWPEPGTNPAQWVRLKTPFRVHPKQPN